jgi:hypothetical protein
MGGVATDYMRSNGNEGVANQLGEVYDHVQFFEVQWGWLVVPLRLVLMSFGFLIGTAVYSSRKPYLFKSSILAALLYGLEGWQLTEIYTVAGGRETEADLVKIANGVKASLVSSDDREVRYVREQ